MSKQLHRRRARRRLRAHDRGEDRHNKGLSLIKKQIRLQHEKSPKLPEDVR